MKSNYNKSVQENGCVYIPVPLQRAVGIQPNDIVRINSYNKTILIEKIEIREVDMVEGLRKSLSEMPMEAIECYVLAALGKMEKSQLAVLMEQISSMLEKK